MPARASADDGGATTGTEADVPLPHPHRPARARAHRLAAALAGALAIALPHAGAAPARAEPVAPAEADRVLVRFDAEADAAERARAARGLGAERVTHLTAGWRAYHLARPVSAAEARAELAAAGAEGRVQLDGRLRPAAVEDPHLAAGLMWGLDNRTWAGGTPGADIDARAGWGALTSLQPTVVAVIDTGVEVEHPDLRDRLWTNPGEVAGNGIDDDGDGRVDDVVGWDFLHRDATVYDPADGDAHGTHVAGTIAATRGNGEGVAGVADNARIMPLKFLGPSGGWTSDAILAIDYAVDHGARVINASWGGSSHSPALCDAIAAATDRGALVVIAAGNDGADRDAVPSWPANCGAPQAVVVAATTPQDGLAGFSARGAATVDLGAPGVRVLSTVPGGYGEMSGTSMATPHVAGIAAALLGERPGLTPAALRHALLAGGDAVPALAGVTASGRRADLTGALLVSAGGTPPPPPPSSGGPAAGAPPAAAPEPDTLAPAPFDLLGPSAGAAVASARPALRWSATADAGSGVAGHEVVVDGAVVATAGPGATAAIPVAPLADGRHAWTVWAVDRAGNRRAARERTVTVDTAAPAPARPLAPSAGAVVPAGSVTLRFAAARDAGSGVRRHRIELDGRTVATRPPGGGAVSVVVGPGPHRWRVSAVDAAGNVAPGAERRFRARATGGAAAAGRRAAPRTPPALRRS